MSELKRIRIGRELSQIELSRMSKVHPSRISLIESGSTAPTESEIGRISGALGVVAEEIFGLDQVMGKLTASRKRENE